MVPAGVALCPICGGAAPGSPTNAKRRDRKLVLVGALLLAILLALGLRRLGSSSSVAAPCVGGQDPKVEWRATDAKPSFGAGHLFQIEPVGVPYIKLAEIRTTGNLTYGNKCDNEWGHIHDPVYGVVAGEGANAFFNNPAQSFTNDNVEVTITAVMAHTGPLPQVIKDRYFPNGRALMIVHITPGTAAESGGMRPADLLVTFKGVALREGRIYEMDAIPAIANEPVDVEVTRGGQSVTLSMVRQGSGKLGFHYGEAPILEVTP